MNDLSTIKVIPFYGKSAESTYAFEDVLLGKIKVPRTDEDYDMKPEEGKKLKIDADMNELSYTKLILSIDVKKISGKVAFNLVKG
jgi:hypothetical protein